MGEIYYVHHRGRKIAVRDLDTGPVPKKKRRQNCCALVPELWVEKLLPALSTSTRWLAVVLLWRSFRSRGHPFTCPNLERYGVSEYQKRKGLAELEQVGLIAVERVLGKSPKVKIVLDPSKN